jgi:hypothetical protein
LAACGVPPGDVNIQRSLYCRKEIRLINGLGEKIDRALFHPGDGHFDIAASGEEDDRQIDACLGKPIPQIESTTAYQLQIQEHACGAGGSAALQKFAGPSECSHFPAARFQQTAQRSSNYRLIVHNAYG